MRIAQAVLAQVLAGAREDDDARRRSASSRARGALGELHRRGRPRSAVGGALLAAAAGVRAGGAQRQRDDGDERRDGRGLIA